MDFQQIYMIISNNEYLDFRALTTNPKKISSDFRGKNFTNNLSVAANIAVICEMVCDGDEGRDKQR